MLSTLLICALLATCWCTPTNHQQSVLSNWGSAATIHVRNATISDIDDISRVVLDAFASDPEFDYQYQFRKQYPRYHLRCSQQLVKQAFESKPDSVVIKVIDVPPHDERREPRHTAAVSDHSAATDAHTLSIGAVAIWDFNTTGTNLMINVLQALRTLSVSSSTAWSTPDCAAHLDANMTRVNITGAQFKAVKDKYIDTAYDSQLYLALLATHPVWQNQGFGPANLAWGLTEASKLQIPVTLIATPAGYPLYVETGFKSVANITINKVDGDEGSGFWYEVMKWLPANDKLLVKHP